MDPSKDVRVPVKEIPSFQGSPTTTDLDCLHLNIAIPPERIARNRLLPVMVWIHGGAYWFGGNYHPIYDVARLVSHSVRDDAPIVAVSINYRLGIGGFLASRQIKEELSKDGFSGVGNFALTDQQVALDWVQRYIHNFLGDPKNVTIFGESAGGISVAHQIQAAKPAKFTRAIQMSGSLCLVANWSLQRHQQRYDALCRHFGIDPASSTTLDQLRGIPEVELHNATTVIEPTDFLVFNPCDDQDFHSRTPDLSYGSSLPPWLEGLMVGDTLDEGELWRHVVMKQDLDFLKARMQKYMSSSETDRVLEIYSLGPNAPLEDVTEAFVSMIGDMMFKMQNFVTLQRSDKPKTFAYHIDQRSTLDNFLKEQAYHAIDLFYVFLNGSVDMTGGQLLLAEKMASDWIAFANGKEPWPNYLSACQWMIYGPEKAQDKWELQDEHEDEPMRHYTRWKQLLDEGLYEKLWSAMEDIAYEHYRIEGDHKHA